MYYYAICYSDYDISIETVFYSDLKYSEDYLESLCNEAVRTYLINQLNTDGYIGLGENEMFSAIESWLEKLYIYPVIYEASVWYDKNSIIEECNDEVVKILNDKLLIDKIIKHNKQIEKKQYEKTNNRV